MIPDRTFLRRCAQKHNLALPRELEDWLLVHFEDEPYEDFNTASILEDIVCLYLNILVREYRCSGGTDTANPAPGNRCSRTEIPHLIVCYLRVYSLKAGSNPYTSRIDL